MTNTDAHKTDETVDVGPEPRSKTVSSDVLFGALNEIVIDHHGAQYRLRITRQDKLILTK